jgi:DNA-binding NarL/FixJ family response regulator
MEKPNFILEPPSFTVMQTALLLAQGKNVTEIAQLRNLTEEAIRHHAKLIRKKFETDDITEAVLRMLALNYVPPSVIIHALPPHWHKYIRKDATGPFEGQ